VKVNESSPVRSRNRVVSQHFWIELLDWFNSFQPGRKNAEAMHFSGAIADAIGCDDCAEALYLAWPSKRRRLSERGYSDAGQKLKFALVEAEYLVQPDQSSALILPGHSQIL